MNYLGRLRDCQAFKDDDLCMTTTSNEAAKFFDAGLYQLIGWYENEELGGIMGTCEKMMSADEDFVMGKVFMNGIKLIGTGDSIRKDAQFAADIQEMSCKLAGKNSNLNDREVLHVKAIQLFSNGYWQEAAAVWETILIDHPKDVLALKLAHDTYFYLGEQCQIRDSISRVIHHFKPTDGFYGYLKGMLSFGQEETNLFREAEKSANEALELNKLDGWATHTLAHIFEMEGRSIEGYQHMNAFENDWNTCGMLACHLYWHWSLYAIEQGNYSDALKIYDHEIAKRCKSGAMLDLVDCTSFLYRLKLEGVNVEERWEDAIELCRPHLDDQVMFFNDVHFLMAFSGGKRPEFAKKEMECIREHLQSENCQQKTYQMTSSAGLAICDAILAFEDQDFQRVVEVLYPQKHKIVQIGGSNAQRDVFNQLLLRSCLQSKSRQHQRLAENLLYERKAMRPNSPLTDRLMAKLLNQNGK